MMPIHFLSFLFSTFLFLGMLTSSPLQAKKAKKAKREKNITLLKDSNHRLIKVKSLSQDRRSFITRQGKSDGITEGSEMVFKAKDVSFKAYAVKVARYYSLWKIANSRMTLPVKAGEYLIAYMGRESL